MRRPTLNAVRDRSCAPSTIGFKTFSSASVPGFAAPTTIERMKSHVSEPRVPVSVRDDATGRARKLTERRPRSSPLRKIA